MYFLNIEIKARTQQAVSIREYLHKRQARFVGTDLQIDTYFRVSNGRLKLRSGPIENNLIYYQRENRSGPKKSDFQLLKVDDTDSMRAMLTEALGILVEVRKEREIYYLDNVKFHIDRVEGLGHFVEIEAGNMLHRRSASELEEQCRFYMEALGISETDLVDRSYSDLLMESDAISE